MTTESEAETLKRLLNANGRNFEIAQHAILGNAKRVPAVAGVIQALLDLRVKKVIGHVPVGKLDCRLIPYWVKSMVAKGRSPPHFWQWPGRRKKRG